MSVRPPSTNAAMLSGNGAPAPVWRRWIEDIDNRVELARAALRGVASVGNRPPLARGLVHTFFAQDVSAAAVKRDAGAATWTVPSGLFEPGTLLTAVNFAPSGDITLTGGATLRLSPGTSTGARTVAPGGIAFIYMVNSSNALVYGHGVT